MSKSVLLLMMGGSGTRFGSEIPKQFTLVSGRPIFSYIVEKYAALNAVDSMILVCHEEWVRYSDDWTKDLELDVPVHVVAGGSTRSESVRNGLEKAASFSDYSDVILIHDATHPYVDEEGVLRVIEATRRCGGATLGECQYDTVYKMDPESHMMQEVVPRESIVSGASPEAFLFGRIWEVYRSAAILDLGKFTSAGALALEYGIPMEVVPTDLINLKITYRRDLEVFRKLFHNYYF